LARSCATVRGRFERVIQFDEEELTEEKIAKKTRLTLRIIEKIEKLYALGLKQAARLNSLPRSGLQAQRRARHQLSRTRIEMSQLVRSMGLHPLEKKRLIDHLRHTVERMDTLGRESARLERAPLPAERWPLCARNCVRAARS
jgi:hypothetical protein